jgi:CheY-like chemotaxis protein
VRALTRSPDCWVVDMRSPFDGARRVRVACEEHEERVAAVHRGGRSNVLRVSPHDVSELVCEHVVVARTAVIVDDHAGFRAQAAELLEAAGCEVVGSCADGQAALALLLHLHPDVVLVDVQLPDIDGFGLIEQLGPGAQGVTIVLVSTREAADYGARVGRSGAAGFITKAELSITSLAAVVEL